MSHIFTISLTFILALPVFGQTFADCYKLETIALPKNLPPEVGALNFDKNGFLYVALRRGDIIRAKPTANPAAFSWEFVASGFHNACGLEPAGQDSIVVSQMAELTQVSHFDNNGEAYNFSCLTRAWGVSGNYHETNAICPDGDGGYYIAVGTASHNGPTFHRVRGDYSKIGRRGRNFSGVAWKGWVMHYSKDGRVRPFAKGFRMHNGIMRDSNGNLWCGDNQGDWRATTPLYHVRKNHFYGHPSSLVWDPEFPKGKDPLKMPLKEINAMRTRAAVLIPHKEMNRSASQPVEIPENFGPFGGQILLPDNNGTRITRIMLDEVNGEFQGSCTHFINGHGLRSGNNRAVFSPDGKTLYIGQTVRGWGKPAEGVQRITWKGKTPYDVQSINLTRKGFTLSFTQPTGLRQIDQAKIRIHSYRYEDKWSYGGPKLDKRTERITQRMKRSDIRHELWLEKLEAGRVYQIEIEGLVSDKGSKLLNKTYCYTLNQLIK